MLKQIVFLTLFLTSYSCYALDSAAVTDSSKNTPTTGISQTSKKTVWNLEDVDIRSLINEVSEETGKNFIIDPRVSGKVTLIANRPMQPNEIYQVFLSTLQVYGYSAIPSGDAVKIVPNLTSRQYAYPLTSQAKPGSGDELIVRVIPVNNIAAAQLIPILRPLLPEWATISTYSPTNVLILSGPADNINRIAEIISRVDTTNRIDVSVIPVKYASAADVVNILNTLRGDDPLSKLMLSADDRSNSILLSGNLKERLRMRILISQLDTPTPYGSSGNIQVVYLRYLKAKDLAPILDKLVQASEATQAKSSAPREKPSILAEPNTNALVINAPQGLMRSLKTVITRLDVKPAQVLVEAVIVEINETTAQKIGIEWGDIGDIESQETDGTLSLTNPALPLVTGGIGVGIIRSGNLRAVINFIQNDRSANLLSTPSLVVMDNQKASIQVGENVAQESGSYATTGAATTATPFTTVNRKDVALKLVVTPQISRSKAVKLNIQQTNDKPTDSTDLNAPVNINNIDTTVMVNSGDILVLGGLISNDQNKIVNKTPVLGDLPLLGKLFRSTHKSAEKRNLMVFIRPLIIANREDGEFATQPKYEFMRRLQLFKSQGGNLSDSSYDKQIIPAWKGRSEPLPHPFDS